jgi:BirA family transcriptional regulator, biotin operon repressor / biotin---[acetyl-CoA-carboxylase] ligase
VDALPASHELGLASLIHRERTVSTMDDAHQAAAAGAPAGTLILADAQESGRGRGGRAWSSAAGAGLWMTLVERPETDDVIGVLSLRVGLQLAQALDGFVTQPVALKWPNDLYVGTGKLAGVLAEARWRDGAVDWIAIGVGINMHVPAEFPEASNVRPDVTRAELLRVAVPALLAAARARGALSEAEQAEWQRRDLAIGRRIAQPVAGVALGVSADGALLVQESGVRGVTAVRAGSLVFAEAQDPTGC